MRRGHVRTPAGAVLGAPRHQTVMATFEEMPGNGDYSKARSTAPVSSARR
jgi:hypothetical protein